MIVTATDLAMRKQIQTVGVSRHSAVEASPTSQVRNRNANFVDTLVSPAGAHRTPAAEPQTLMPKVGVDVNTVFLRCRSGGRALREQGPHKPSVA